MNCIKKLFAIFMLTFAFSANADPGCNDAAIWGSKMISGVCWSCVLPFRIAGVQIGSGGSYPAGANNQPLCTCPDPLGLPKLGFSLGAWLPYRLFENVRNPFCMPAFGGIFLGQDWTNLAGPKGDGTTEAQKGSYYHTHVYSFPLATMMELITNKECNPGGYQDMDIIMMSEFDPVSSDDLLAMFIYFETAMFANPLATAACGVECGQLSAGQTPTNSMFWCAGCWGALYPLTNTSNVRASKHQESSLVDARQLAVKHRRGMGHLTYGTGNMCGGKLAVFVPKEQYKWQHIFPVADSNKPCCHWTGSSEYLTGGVRRELPTIGEDIVQLLYRYTDCCAN